MSIIPCIGDRIRLVAMHDDPDPIQAGQTGTVGGGRRVVYPPTWPQLDVAGGNGRTLVLVSPPDRFDIIEASEAKPS